jgi:ElaB/YqjD/DUF883 family membrane-anchored ribosome-binding protein
MFGTHLLDRRSKTERVADQAREYLLSAVGSAKDTAKDTARSARDRTSDFAGDAGGLVGSAAEEARRRANAAIDALAGRKVSRSTPWTLIAVAGLVGAAIGWAAGTASRAAMARFTEGADERPVDSIEFVDADRPPGSTAGA